MYRAKTENCLIAMRKLPNLDERLGNFRFFLFQKRLFLEKYLYLCAVEQKNKGIMEQVRTPLNAAQMDFLQLLGHIKTVEELEELSQVVSDFYARKAEEGMNRLWETGQWSKEKDEEMMKAHLRTPYKYAK